MRSLKKGEYIKIRVRKIDDRYWLFIIEVFERRNEKTLAVTISYYFLAWFCFKSKKIGSWGRKWAFRGKFVETSCMSRSEDKQDIRHETEESRNLNGASPFSLLTVFSLLFSLKFPAARFRWTNSLFSLFFSNFASSSRVFFFSQQSSFKLMQIRTTSVQISIGENREWRFASPKGDQWTKALMIHCPTFDEIWIIELALTFFSVFIS